MLNLGLIGIGKHFWKSINRTRQFYLDTLTKYFHCTFFETLEEAIGAPSLDAVINFSGSFGWKLRDQFKCPFIYSIHGGAILDQDFLRDNLSRLENTDVLLFNCTSDLSIFETMFSSIKPNLCHLPLPVDHNIFRLLPKEECKIGEPFGKFDYIIGFVNRLLPQKNLHQFIEMLARLKIELYPKQIAGLIIGSYWIDYPVLPYITDTYPEIIKQMITKFNLQENIINFPGQLSEEELVICYNVMDVLFHPTNAIDENFGYVPVEAMACGVPVVGTAYGGLKDTILHGKTGFLMPSWATQSGIRMDLINGKSYLHILLKDKELRRNMSEAARYHSNEQYNYSKCGKVLCETIEQAVFRKKAGEARPLQLNSLPTSSPFFGLLPKVQKPWEYYFPVVSKYVQLEKPPQVDALSYLQLPFSIKALGNELYQLEDPAWPARFKLDEKEAALIKQNNGKKIKHWHRNSNFIREKINRWIDEGLLICSVPN